MFRSYVNVHAFNFDEGFFSQKVLSELESTDDTDQELLEVVQKHNSMVINKVCSDIKYSAFFNKVIFMVGSSKPDDLNASINALTLLHNSIMLRLEGIDESGVDAFLPTIEEMYDDFSLARVYGQTHKIASENKEDKVFFDSYQSRDAVKLFNCLNDNKNLIPRNVQLRVNEYSGVGKGVLIGSVEGTGDIDDYYAENIHVLLEHLESVVSRRADKVTNKISLVKQLQMNKISRLDVDNFIANRRQNTKSNMVDSDELVLKAVRIEEVEKVEAERIEVEIPKSDIFLDISVEISFFDEYPWVKDLLIGAGVGIVVITIIALAWFQPWLPVVAAAAFTAAGVSFGVGASVAATSAILTAIGGSILAAVTGAAVGIGALWRSNFTIDPWNRVNDEVVFMPEGEIRGSNYEYANTLGYRPEPNAFYQAIYNDESGEQPNLYPVDMHDMDLGQWKRQTEERSSFSNPFSNGW